MGNKRKRKLEHLTESDGSSNKRKWLKRFGVLAIVAVIIIAIFTTLKPEYPQVVNNYSYRCQQMNQEQLKNDLHKWAVNHSDSLDGLNYTKLLDWEHGYLEYSLNLSTDGSVYQRPELPVAILEGEASYYFEGYVRSLVYNYNYTSHKAMGRCGEFTLLYYGLLVANGYKARIVIDCSYKTNSSKSSAGDHVWVELQLEDGTWMHIDPTEKRVNAPGMYAEEWNKEINKVYAVDGTSVVDVTSTYARD